jgi:hypothetical protein
VWRAWRLKPNDPDFQCRAKRICGFQCRAERICGFQCRAERICGFQQ